MPEKSNRRFQIIIHLHGPGFDYNPDLKEIYIITKFGFISIDIPFEKYIKIHYSELSIKSRVIFSKHKKNRCG